MIASSVDSAFKTYSRIFNFAFKAFLKPVESGARRNGKNYDMLLSIQKPGKEKNFVSSNWNFHWGGVLVSEQQ